MDFKCIPPVCSGSVILLVQLVAHESPIGGRFVTFSYCSRAALKATLTQLHAYPLIITWELTEWSKIVL